MKRGFSHNLLIAAPCLAALLSHTLSAQSTAPQTPRLTFPALSEPTVTLRQLQQMAVANNPTLGQSRAAVQAAAGRTRQVGLWPNPTIGYAGDEIRGGSFGGGQHGVFVQQDVILGGKLRLNRQVFAAEERQAEAAVEEQRLRVDTGVRIAFYQSLAAQQMVEVRSQLSTIADDALQTTRQLFNIGQADEPDVLQAEVEANEADLAVVAAEFDQQRAWQVLGTVVGTPDLALTRLQGNLEELPLIDPEQALQTILRDSPAITIAGLGVTHAEAALTRARREVAPDLLLRAGYLNNREQLGTTPPTAVGSEGFAEVAVSVRLFNRNQGNVQAARADEDRARLEVQRVALVLRQLAAPILQNYASSRVAADRYKTKMLPNAQRASELFLQKYREGAAAYPQVLIAQRTLFQLQIAYISALETAWLNAITLQGLLLTDGLGLPAMPGELK